MNQEASNWQNLKPETFAVEGSHEVVEKYRPEFIGKGAEHIVYQSPEHPNSVVKVNVNSIEHSLQLQGSGLDVDEILEDADVQDEIKSWKECKTREFEAMRDYFGVEHTLPQRPITMRVPRVPEIVSAIARLRTGYDVFQDHLSDELLVVAIVQQKCEVLETGEYESLHQSYSLASNEECIDKFRQLMSSSNNELVAGSQFDELIVDPKKREAVSDFVARAIEYSNDTGQILDIAGNANVILHQTGEGYTYTLVDAMYPDAKVAILQEMKEFIQTKLANVDAQVSTEDLQDLSAKTVNAINYVTFINGLSAALGSEERIDWLSDEEFSSQWDSVAQILSDLREQWLLQVGGGE